MSAVVVVVVAVEVVVVGWELTAVVPELLPAESQSEESQLSPWWSQR